MNCKKYRIKKEVNRNGVIFYIAQKKILGLFWAGMFGEYKHYEDWFSTPKIFYKEKEAIEYLKTSIKIEQDRKYAYRKAKEKIKNNKYICIQ